MLRGVKLSEQIDTAARWIAAARHVVAFTGAGISTDSGLPDFRGPDGVWTRRDAGLPPPRPRVAWDQVQPNRSHNALVMLQKLGRLHYLISQNVDNLHRASGADPDRLAELHGNGQLMRCLGCDELVSFAAAGWDKARWGNGYRTEAPRAGQPACASCGGRLISSVVNFGDPMPETELDAAYAHSRRCDVFLAIGSSLVVSPANDMPQVALDRGAKLILINLGDTPFDDAAHLRIASPIGAVLPPMAEQVASLTAPSG